MLSPRARHQSPSFTLDYARNRRFGWAGVKRILAEATKPTPPHHDLVGEHRAAASGLALDRHRNGDSATSDSARLGDQPLRADDPKKPQRVGLAGVRRRGVDDQLLIEVRHEQHVAIQLEDPQLRVSDPLGP